MIFAPPEWLLIGAVAGVGVLHTLVPDHWVPITLIARQRRWTTGETVRTALVAGTGHVLSTLAIAVVVWLAGVAVARAFGGWVDAITSLALVGFGAWIAISAWRETQDGSHAHGHSHGHTHPHPGGRGAPHEHDLHERRIALRDGTAEISIHETDAPPHFRLTGGAHIEGAEGETLRSDGSRQHFVFADRGAFWESVEEVPEPHEFGLTVTLRHAGHEHRLQTAFYEHDHSEHAHETGARERRSRTALLMILGSSPMVEGIPAFFAAGRYGFGLILVMSAVFAAATIATYVALCAGSHAGLRQAKFGRLERYGEVISGAFIAAVGLVFWLLPAI
jgi:ABC-type nickel/cobalt efflux system permease component RcnA